MSLSIEELSEIYPEEFKKMGSIFYALNTIDMSLTVTLTGFFTDISYPHAEKNFIFNDALVDPSIFSTFENKLNFITKCIHDIGRLAQEKGKKFDQAKWLKLCTSIRKVQQIRNKLAHHRVLFPGNEKGKVAYQVRKGPKERIIDQKQGNKTGSIKIIRIDLDTEFNNANKIAEESQKFFSEFLTEARKIQG